MKAVQRRAVLAVTLMVAVCLAGAVAVSVSDTASDTSSAASFSYTKTFDVTAGEKSTVTFFDSNKSYSAVKSDLADSYLTFHWSNSNASDLVSTYFSDMAVDVLIPSTYTGTTYTKTIEFHYTEGALFLGQTTNYNDVTLVFNVSPGAGCTVTFNGNGGTASTGSIASDHYGSAITLPNAVRSGYSFNGWYTSAADSSTCVGTKGDSYTPAADITLYAHWTYVPTYTYITSGSYYQISSGGVVTIDVTTSPSSAAVTVTSWGDLGSLLSLSGHRISGTLTDVLPGDYYIRIEAKADSTDYGSSQTVRITVPVFVYDPITDQASIGVGYTYNLTANPSSAKISSATVRNNADGSVLPSGTWYSITELPAKSMTATFSSVGVYRITMTIAAAGYTSTTKDLVLTVVDPAEDDNAISHGELQVTKHATLDGGYYCVISQPAHYTSITWDFGDGSSQASGASVIHQYTSSGDHTVTCTLYNKYTKETVSVTAGVTVTLSLLSPNDAWVGVLYSYAFVVTNGTAGTYALAGVYEDDAASTQSWLTLKQYDDSGSHYLVLAGTPAAGNESRVLDVTVSYTEDGATSTVKTLAVSIWPAVDDTQLRISFDVTAAGYVVTVTNTGTSEIGTKLFVDWGLASADSFVKQTSSKTASHDYSDAGAGTYSIKCLLTVNGENYTATKSVTLPTSAVSYAIKYESNDGSDRTAEQSSGSDYVVAGYLWDLPTGGPYFQGWNTAADGSGQSYPAGATVTLVGNLTLYAQWDEKQPEPEPVIDWGMVVVVLVVMLIIILMAALFFGLI